MYQTTQILYHFSDVSNSFVIFSIYIYIIYKIYIRVSILLVHVFKVKL
jgi:hypothetical protein